MTAEAEIRVHLLPTAPGVRLTWAPPGHNTGSRVEAARGAASAAEAAATALPAVTWVWLWAPPDPACSPLKPEGALGCSQKPAGKEAPTPVSGVAGAPLLHARKDLSGHLGLEGPAPTGQGGLKP